MSKFVDIAERLLVAIDEKIKDLVPDILNRESLLTAGSRNELENAIIQYTRQIMRVKSDV